MSSFRAIYRSATWSLSETYLHASPLGRRLKSEPIASLKPAHKNANMPSSKPYSNPQSDEQQY